MSEKMTLFGTVFFDINENSWIGKGDGWWLSNSQDNEVQINFIQPLSIYESEQYRIQVNLNSGNGKFLYKNPTIHGFTLRCNPQQTSGMISAHFKVSGVNSNAYFDDRALTDEESIADIHASSLVLNYEAKYGFVSVMGSASIKDSNDHKARIAQLNQRIDNLNSVKTEDNHLIPLERLDKQIALEEGRLQRETLLQEKTTRYYQSAETFGKLWAIYCKNEQAERLYGAYVPICTGGGPGIMKAVANGARQQDGHVLAFDCAFGDTTKFFHMKDNVDLLSDTRLRMNNFAIRESILINYSHVILFWPGGYGTVWEVCETLSKIQTKHLQRRRIKAIFVHKEYWEPFFAFVKQMQAYGTINQYGDLIKGIGMDDTLPDDAYVAEVVDSAEEAFEKTKQFIEFLADNNDLVLRKE